MIPQPASGLPKSQTFALQNAREMVRAANGFDQLNSRIDPIQLQNTYAPATACMAMGLNTESIQLNVFDVLKISGVRPNFEDLPAWGNSNAIPSLSYQAITVEKPQTLTDMHTIAVAMAPILSGRTNWIATRGVIACEITVLAGLEWCDRVDYVTGNDKLTTHPAGCATILSRQSGTGLKKAVVSLDAAQQHIYPARATTDITPGGSGSFILIDDDKAGLTYTSTCELRFMHGGQKISANKEILVLWDTMKKKWYVIGAECED